MKGKNFNFVIHLPHGATNCNFASPLKFPMHQQSYNRSQQLSHLNPNVRAPINTSDPFIHLISSTARIHAAFIADREENGEANSKDKIHQLLRISSIVLSQSSLKLLLVLLSLSISLPQSSCSLRAS